MMTESDEGLIVKKMIGKLLESYGSIEREGRERGKFNSRRGSMKKSRIDWMNTL
jgi:hypothetical protein